MFRPRPLCVISRTRSFARFTEEGAGFNRGERWLVTVYPRNFRFQGRSTALLSRFTMNRLSTRTLPEQWQPIETMCFIFVP